MNKAHGLPHADAAAILQHGFGWTMSRGGICRAIQRVARQAETTWHALPDAGRRSVVAHRDETWWKVEAQLRWLWAVVPEQVIFCEILPGRGFAQASAILGAEYAGWLIHDGWKIYYKFRQAAHWIRRCRDLAAAATPAAAVFPLAVKQILGQGRPCAIATWRTRSRCMACVPLPGGWKPSWAAGSGATIGIRPIGDWPSIYGTSSLTCSPFSTVPGWSMPPTI
jgi:hypothetical protein